MKTRFKKIRKELQVIKAIAQKHFLQSITMQEKVKEVQSNSNDSIDSLDFIDSFDSIGFMDSADFTDY